MELASIHRARRPGRLIMAAPSYVFTIGRVAEMLGEDEQSLQTIADDAESAPRFQAAREGRHV
jgi:hypothetical protein